MYLNGFQCDNCEKIHNIGDCIPNPFRDMVPKLPEGWSHVQEQDKPARHFCSMSCMSQWSSNVVKQQEKQWNYREDRS
jgi:hypothetical protein